MQTHVSSGGCRVWTTDRPYVETCELEQLASYLCFRSRTCITSLVCSAARTLDINHNGLPLQPLREPIDGGAALVA